MNNLADKTAAQLDHIDLEVELKTKSHKKIMDMANAIYYKRGVLEQIARTNEEINRRLLKSMFWNTLGISISISILTTWFYIFIKILLLPYEVKLHIYFAVGIACSYMLLNRQLHPSIDKIKVILAERKSYKIQESLAEKKINADQDFKEFKNQIVKHNESLIEIADQLKSIWKLIKETSSYAHTLDLPKFKDAVETFNAVTDRYLNLALNFDEIIKRVNVESSVDFETIVYKGKKNHSQATKQRLQILDVIECEKAILMLREERKSKN